MGFLPRIAFWSVVVLLATACTKHDRPAPSSAKPALRKVVLQTDWFPQAEHGGFYQAVARGFYTKVGLEVDILPGGPGAGIKLKVAKGDADFGLLRSDDIIVAASRGLPLVMVAATMQHDPQALLVHAGSPVRNFRDLNGQVVIANVGMTWIPYLKKKYGITFELRQNTFGFGEFLANPDLIQQGLVTNEPFFARQHGILVRTLLLADSGYDCYHAIFCRRDLVRGAPEVVRAFVLASLHGWQDYLEGDPTPADRMILQRNAEMTPEFLKFSRDEMIVRALVHGDRKKGEGIGQLSLARLSDEMEVLLSLKILDAPIAITSVATKDFLPPVAP